MQNRNGGDKSKLTFDSEPALSVMELLLSQNWLYINIWAILP